MLQGEGFLGDLNVLREESHLVKVNCSFDFKTFGRKQLWLFKTKANSFSGEGLKSTILTEK